MNLFSRLLKEINTIKTASELYKRKERSFKVNHFEIMIERIWEKRDEDIFEGLKTLNVNKYLIIYWLINTALRHKFPMQ